MKPLLIGGWGGVAGPADLCFQLASLGVQVPRVVFDSFKNGAILMSSCPKPSRHNRRPARYEKKGGAREKEEEERKRRRRRRRRTRMPKEAERSRKEAGKQAGNKGPPP